MRAFSLLTKWPLLVVLVTGISAGTPHQQVGTLDVFDRDGTFESQNRGEAEKVDDVGKGYKIIKWRDVTPSLYFLFFLYTNTLLDLAPREQALAGQR